MVRGLGESSGNYSALPPNWGHGLSWLSRWVSYGEWANVCDSHWTRPMANHDARLSIVTICQNTILHELLTFRGYWAYAKINKRLGWDPKVVIYPYGLGHYWWKRVATGIFNIGTMISHRIEMVCPLKWSKGHVIMKFVVTIIPLVEFDICFLELE